MKRLTNAEKAELHKKLEEAEKAKFKPYEDRIAELEEKLEQTEKDLADYQFNYPTIKELEKENAELRARECFVGDQNRKLCEQQQKIEVLEKENAELRKEWQEQVQKATDEGYARTLQTIQLAKAIEIIKKYYEYNPSCEYFYEDIDKEAEQFLKDSEVKNV